jgi:hypothetical protein
MILALEAAPLTELLEQELDNCGAALRSKMSDFAERHGIPV